VTSVLFVCLGNICRSPAGEAILKQLAGDAPIEVSSCALGDWHVGQRADPRMRAAAKERGLVLKSIAKELTPDMFAKFDYILAADHSVLEEIKSRTRGCEVRGKICLITEYSKAHHREEIPDPYFGDEGGFEGVLDMLEEACSELLAHILSDSRK
jgi:low molecular weight protein-tyrosine phosphatase